MHGRIARIIGSSGSLRSKLFRGSALSIIVKVFYILTQFAVGVLLARLLGPEALGLYAFTMALVQVLVIISQFGFPAYLVRTIALYDTQGYWSQIKGLVTGAIKLVALLSLLVVVFLYVWLSGPGIKSDQHPQNAIMIGLSLVPLLALTATSSGASRGLGYVVASQIPDQVVRPLVILISLVAWALSGAVLSPENALLMHASAAFASLMLGWILLSRQFPMQFKKERAEFNCWEHLYKSLPFLLLAGTQVINYQADVLMLGTLGTQENVGLYRVSVQVADGLGVALIAISIVIAPHLARLHANKDWETIRGVLVCSHRAGTFLMLPIAVMIIFLSSFFLKVLFGPNYIPASEALEILVLGKLAYAMVGFSGMALSMLGRAGIATIIALITVAINVSLNAFLIPKFGIEGAAIATAISQFIVNFVGILYIAYIFNMDVSAIGSSSLRKFFLKSG